MAAQFNYLPAGNLPGSRFSPYRGADVKIGAGGFVKVSLGRFKGVWATLQQRSGEYYATILGHGTPPIFEWSELSEANRELLLTTLTAEELAR